jgi:predicted ester cyclase
MPTAETFCQEWFRRVWNTLEEGAIDELVDPDCVAHGLGPEPLHGPDAFKALHKTFTDAFQDIHIEAIQEVRENDLIAAYSSVQLVSKANGQQVTFYGCPMIRVKDHKIVEAWNVWDFLTLAEHTGAAPRNSLQAALAAPV